MSLRVEWGGDREDGQSVRPQAGSVQRTGQQPKCPGQGTDLGPVGSVLGQPLHQVAVACLHPFDQLDRTCVNSEFLTH